MISKMTIARRTMYLFQSDIADKLLQPWSREGVVVLHTGRCGSTVISSMLAQDKQFRVFGEIFNAGVREDRRMNPNKLEFTLKGLKNMAVPRIPVVELKALSTQDLRDTEHDLPDFLNAAEQSGYSKFILLCRENYLRQVLSFRTAIERQRYHYSKDEAVPKTSVTIGVESIDAMSSRSSLVEHFRFLDEEYEYIRDLLKDRNALELTYENDVEKGPEVAVDKIFEFASVAPAKVQPTLVKSANQTIQDATENWDQVVEALRGTKYEWMTQTDSTASSP